MIPSVLQLIIKLVSCILMLASLAAVFLVIRKKSMPRTNRPVRRRWIYIVLGAILSRVFLLVISLFVGNQSLGDTWTRWDAVHYKELMTLGYTADGSTDAWLNIVFFPLYPTICRFLGGSFWSMIAVSWACFAGAAVVIGRMSSASESPWAVLWICVFPVTVFLGAPYTESMFLLTTGLCLMELKHHRWGSAGVFGMFAALTRNLGVLTALAFVTEFLMMYWKRVRSGEAKWKGIFLAIIKEGGLWCALIPFGTLLYLAINQLVFGDLFVFLTVQKEHWNQSFGFFGQTLVTSIHYSVFYKDIIYRLCLFIPQTILMILSLLTFPFLLRKMSAMEAVYSFAYFFCILSPTWLLSFPRYLMGLVTLYPALAKTVRPLWARILLTVISFACMIPLTICYLKGWPVL